jgi:hypothetical protein
MDERTVHNNTEQSFSDFENEELDGGPPPPNYEIVEDFRSLYEQAYRQIYHDLKLRISTNPIPTEEELSMGAYVEELEPQVRDAVLMMRRKGYDTDNSGFDYGGGSKQVIDGLFSVAFDTANRLNGLGVEVKVLKPRPIYSSIEFFAKEPDLGVIKERWDKIVNLLPDLGQPSKPSPSVVSERFRLMYKAGTLKNDFMMYWLRDVLGAGMGQHKEIYPGDLHY